MDILYAERKNLHFSTPVHPFELIPVRFCFIFRGDLFRPSKNTFVKSHFPKKRFSKKTFSKNGFPKNGFPKDGFPKSDFPKHGFIHI